MALKPKTKYDAELIEAFLSESKEKKTPMIYMNFHTEDGNISHNMYVTVATQARVAETMYDVFGCTDSDLRAMCESGDWSRLKGKICSITTDEGDDQYGVRVKWVNSAGFRPKPATSATARAVVGMFGGGPVSHPGHKAPAAQSIIDDDSVPF
jgi:hypothetical protein